MFQPQPQVTSTVPLGESVDVDTRVTLNIFFNTDLDRNHITDSVFLLDGQGNSVDINVGYNNRVIFITGVTELLPSTRYTIRIAGGLDASGNPAGIRSILNSPLARDFGMAFTTVVKEILPAPVPIFPPYDSIVQAQPTFSWEPVDGAVGYQIKVSLSKNMSSILWPSDSDTAVFTATMVNPSYQFSDATYYWIIRAVATDGSYGEWSTVYTFNKDTTVQGTQAPGDTIAPDAVPFYEEQYNEPLTIVESFPPDGGTNIAVNLRTIYIRISGVYRPGDITPDMIDFVGLNVDGVHNNPDFLEHLNVAFELEVQPQNDGTTILAIKPDIVANQTYIPNLP